MMKDYVIEVKTPDLKEDVIDPSPIRYETSEVARRRLDEAWLDDWVAESEWEEIPFAGEWHRAMRLRRNGSAVALVLKEVAK